MTAVDDFFEAGGEDRLTRIGTGSREVDLILGGGFPSSSINIVMGEPGTGKTILAEQTLFHNATSERPALYMTTLSEPLTKVVRYLQEFEFYDAEKLGDAVRYDEMGSDLVEHGLSSLVPRVKEAIRTSSPAILVIDSFKAVHDLSTSVPEIRRLVSELASVLSAYQVTTFLVGEYSENHVPLYPEFAVADSVVQLQRRTLGTRDERYFRVLKLRGSDYLQGLHAFRITNGGIELYPRLVGPTTPDDHEPIMERVPTGTPGLDAMLHGGLWAGSSTLVAGTTGSGKTTVALQFVLEGVHREEPVLFVTFQENPSQLARHITHLGGDFEALARNGLHILYISPVELQIDHVIVDIFDRLDAHGIRRLAVDAVGDLALAEDDSKRIHDYLYAFVQHLAQREVTSMMTFETAGQEISGEGELQSRFNYFTDTILLLDFQAEPQRTIRVVKSRGSGHDTRRREMVIDERGVRVVVDTGDNEGG